jgi:Serine phosphatase RsbU, regulator of sigma subunit
MIEPKNFYRKLDSLQNKIGAEKTGKDYLFSIVKELEKTLGNELKIENGSIYERVDTEFLLISSPPKFEKILRQRIPYEDPAIQLVSKSKTYIFDRPVYCNESAIAQMQEYKTHAAFIVNNPVNSWVFAFELKSGWIREEVELCLNAVRTALNFRLVSESVKGEFEQAVQIQQSLLPDPPPDVYGYQIAGKSLPAELVGGDLYDYYLFEDVAFGFCVGDASGHGLSAALMVRDVITGLRMGLEKQMKMVHTLKKLNSVIYRSVYSAKFISLFYAEMENNGNLFFANAGHPSPLLFEGDNIHRLEPTGMIIGAFPQIEITRSFINVPIGGILVLFTDGILERKNRRSEMFGFERLQTIVLQNRDKDAKTIMNKIFEAADVFGKSKKWEDDATVVVIKREK